MHVASPEAEETSEAKVVGLPEAEKPPVVKKTPEQIEAEKLAAERIKTLRKLDIDALRILRQGVRPIRVYYSDIHAIEKLGGKMSDMYDVLNSLIGQMDPKLKEPNLREKSSTRVDLQKEVVASLEVKEPPVVKKTPEQIVGEKLAAERIETLNGLDLEALIVLRDGARPANIYYSDRHDIEDLNEKKRKMYVVLNTLIGERDPQLAEPKREKKAA